jgi:hypothetical protein
VGQRYWITFWFGNRFKTRIARRLYFGATLTLQALEPSTRATIPAVFRAFAADEMTFRSDGSIAMMGQRFGPTSIADRS